MNEFKKYQEMVENTIDIDVVENQNCAMILDPGLQEIKKRLDNIEEEMIKNDGVKYLLNCYKL